MTAFGVAPRMAGSKFFPVQKAAVVPRCRIPSKPVVWLEGFFPFPAVHVTYGDERYTPRVDGLEMFTVDELIARTCADHGITREELSGEGKARHYVVARRELAEKLTRRGWSTPMIGDLLHRDHSTIVYMLGRSKRNVERRERMLSAKEGRGT